MVELDLNQRKYLEQVLGVSSIIDINSIPHFAPQRLGDISYEGSLEAPLVFVVHGPLTDIMKELLRKIEKATGVGQVLMVTIEGDISKDSLEPFFSKVKALRGIIFGQSSHQQMGLSEKIYYDCFQNFVTLYGVNWVSTHSLMDMTDGEEKRVSHLKKQTWEQIKKVVSHLRESPNGQI